MCQAWSTWPKRYGFICAVGGSEELCAFPQLVCSVNNCASAKCETGGYTDLPRLRESSVSKYFSGERPTRKPAAAEEKIKSSRLRREVRGPEVGRSGGQEPLLGRNGSSPFTQSQREE